MIMLSDTLAWFAALTLLTAAAHKLLHMERVGAAAARLAQLRQSAGHTLARLAAATEFVAGCALLLAPFRDIGAALAAGLWSSYALLLLMASVRGQKLDCGCSLFSRGDRSTVSPVLPTILAVIALVIIALPGGEGMSIEAPFAALALFSLCFASGELAHITRLPKARA